MQPALWPIMYRSSSGSAAISERYATHFMVGGLPGICEASTENPFASSSFLSHGNQIESGVAFHP
jgi:hypothetical protein